MSTPLSLQALPLPVIASWGPMDHERRTSVFLLREARAGDSGAREELFGRLYPQLHEMVRRRMGQRLRRADESVDVVQSVITDALGELERFEPRGDGALLRWLTRIAENKLRAELLYAEFLDRVETGGDKPDFERFCA